MEHRLPLDNILVLDLTRLLPGGYATMVLRDLGASVIKIENPDGGDELRAMKPIQEGKSVFFSAINRGKKSVALNLKHHKGREIFLKLAQKADVIVESYRPGVAARLGVDYESARQIKPDIIYCSITGYGQDGPRKDEAGHDINYLGYAGVISMTGLADGTLCIPGVQIADIGCGALMAVTGILAALYKRTVTGEGEYLDVSMLDGAVSWMPFQIAEYCVTGNVPAPGNWTLTGKHPCYNLYQAKDREYVAVGALERKFWVNLCDALGRPELVDLQFAEGAEGESAKTLLASIFAARTRDDWIAFFEGKDVCVTAVCTLDETIRDPHVTYRNVIDRTGAPVPYVRFPVKFRAPVCAKCDPAPALGEHTNEILSSLGYIERELRDLAASGTVVSSFSATTK
jgi:crotonobetainyl-CoA:carnitine CoA-transferase CaiB-like acyl-CoA transferase